MKVIVVIISILTLQASASFFDEFRGAVSSVESSFGKLLSDVIYDVKETIDCTLLAVEQVLALGIFGDSSDYENRCRDTSEPPVQPVIVINSQPAPPPVQDTSHEKIVPVLSIAENRQVDTSILDVDEVLAEVLKKDDTHSQLEGVKLALKNETARLNEISDLLRKQLEELSNEVKDKFKAIDLQTSEPSVESIWNDIKLLHEIEHKHQNTAEAKKISHILDQILSILDANEEDRTTADDYKIKEIMRKLSKQSKDNDLWKDADDYPKDFRDYAKRLFDESRGSTSPDDVKKKPADADEQEKSESSGNSKEKSKSDDKKIEKSVSDDDKKDTPDKGDSKKKKAESDDVKIDKAKSDNDNKKKQDEPTTVKPKKRKRKTKATTTTTTTEKPLTVEELAAEYGSLFDVMPDIDSIHAQQAAESAKNIIEDTKLNDEVMNSLADIKSSKGVRDLFDNLDSLDE
ncbi:hypothetical protein MSG28_002891 [Choristoneura fumiferana]|uniref:Uncharacterized protein n=1 Tax=Choristoneura fumiferana TaxID=7141 RepID=A0ACC0JJR8_CHOFU|nr:hypothetical protein MSG28_002891 [Choristoneura fumiferana]